MRRSFVCNCCDLYLSIFLLRMLICSFTISYLFVNFESFSSVYWVFELYWFDIVDNFYKISLDSYFPLVYVTEVYFLCSFSFILAYNSYILLTNIWISVVSSKIVPFLWVLVFFLDIYLALFLIGNLSKVILKSWLWL